MGMCYRLNRLRCLHSHPADRQNHHSLAPLPRHLTYRLLLESHRHHPGLGLNLPCLPPLHCLSRLQD